MKIYTIGFTKSTAESFFTRLKEASVKKVIDVRLNNVSQLAGFTKKDDLKYFLKAICGIDYKHMPELAPTQDILDAYKKHKGDWSMYEKLFLELLRTRRVEEVLPRIEFDHACLLCSEDKPQHCHRRLIAEYLRDKWGDIEIIHL
ncbi:MAG: DUF488 domain-containing protein [Syntrophorhabdaceae bacterium]|nr:DUF488 domain-containing protein [Syntrophorhabdaceae bacterium]